MTQTAETIPPGAPGSVEFGLALGWTTAQWLYHETNAIARGEKSLDAHEKPGDATKGPTPVTALDVETEQKIRAGYQDTCVDVQGEEMQVAWEGTEPPLVTVHLDPIDGTGLFQKYLDTLKAWYQLPKDKRPARPVCGAMISQGTVDEEGVLWGAMVAPFLSPRGPVAWVAGRNSGPAERIEPNGRRYPLPLATTRDHSGRGVLISSKTTHRLLGDKLVSRGLDPLLYQAGVAGALCVMDPELFDRLHPGMPKLKTTIIASIMRNGENWDTAGVHAVANSLGAAVCTMQGQERTYEPGNRGAIISLAPGIGSRVILAISG